MHFDRLKRRDVVALLGGALIWPFAAQAREPSGAETARRIGLDPRLTPARPDLAAKHLAGAVEAKSFVEGHTLEVAAAQAPLRESPSHDAPLLTEALKGERAAIYEMRDDGWAWGQLAGDSYVGYMPGATLRARDRRELTRSRHCARSPIPARRSNARRPRPCRSAAGLPSPAWRAPSR